MKTNFSIEATDSESWARAAVFTTAHGRIQTPIFMPVGTAGTVKSIDQHDLIEDVKAQIILGNTYHLMLRPGTEVLAKAGGLHRFMNWNQPLLTDSGGYQVFSLSQTRKITEVGVKFNSHIDGSKQFLSPETSIDIQRIIGADIIMAFDECTAYPASHLQVRKSMQLTHRWLSRCCVHFDAQQPLYGFHQMLFPIVQGGVYSDLRRESTKVISDFDREGNAIGGLSVGEPAQLMYEITELVCHELPKGKPRYLMGVGTPANILECIALGVDMFDCVMPTRNARNGMLFTRNGIMNMRNKKWKDDFSAIEEGGASVVDESYSKAYLRHLFVSHELLAARIATLHNLAFYRWLVTESRQRIINGTFSSWKNEMVNRVGQRL
ncbi:MAG: tRNA guanosine(34) transglycosylase Tgt [Bacteroidia bacterium]|nr:tRNA guanosine(34) transglycosylase Tgt [Bacteroidia bacterium]MCZ2277740.1 tRNA guanosine(34) transglycosylase Tgt [Bacteroidia bacterium]